jgi:transposase
VRANHRQHRVLGCRPADRVEADKAAMLALPPVAPTVGWRASTRLPRDHYVRLDGNDYSVHPSAVGRRVEVTADLHRVRVWCQGSLVADHARLWAKHQTIADPDHVEAAKLLRRKRFDVVAPRSHVEVEQRRLADYDALLGFDGPVA